MLHLINYPHYINWQAPDHRCYPTYFSLSAEISSCDAWRPWDSWLQGLCIVQVPIFTAAKSWQVILKELLLLTNQFMRLKN